MSRTIRIRRSASIIVTLLMTTSCGSNYSPEAHRVDPARALTTLESVLTSWQQGESPQSWRARDPEVVIQDFDWSSGKQLQAFELLDDGNPVDANLHCRVHLTLVDAQQGEIERAVTYLVTTSPKLTVFRTMAP